MAGNLLWGLIQRLIGDAIVCASRKGQSVLAAAITAISPVLILFDPLDPDRAIAMPYWHLPSVDAAASGLDRTIRRIRMLRTKGVEARLSCPVICDLIGYLNFRLTGHLAVNSITAGELGFVETSQVQRGACARQSANQPNLALYHPRNR